MKLLVENIGETLKSARLKEQMLLKDVSNLSNLSSGYISRIENGSSKPSLDALKSLCNIYSLNINDYVDNTYDNKLNSLDLKDFLLNNNLAYKGEDISIKNKLNVLRFVEFISQSDENLIDVYMSILENLNKLNKKEN